MRKAKLLIATLAMSAIMASTALAGEWKQDQTGWWYQNDDGSHQINQWLNESGDWYYFGSDGYMLTSTTTPDGYHVDLNGKSSDHPLCNPLSIDGITIMPLKYASEDRPYSDVYDKNIIVSYNIKNDTDAPYFYAFTGWHPSLPDGTKLKLLTTVSDMKAQSISPHSEQTLTLTIQIPKDVNVSEIAMYYSFMNYDEQYWSDFGGYLSGSTPASALTKYTDKPKMEFKFFVK